MMKKIVYYSKAGKGCIKMYNTGIELLCFSMNIRTYLATAYSADWRSHLSYLWERNHEKMADSILTQSLAQAKAVDTLR